jgi:uncharacterized OB-fold protein
MISSVPILWRLKNERYQMVGSTCPDCGEVAFPPREVCPHCADNVDTLFPVNMGKTTEELLTEAYLVEAHA